jgi:membrane-associated PAP2 superfamily phosphatase
MALRLRKTEKHQRDTLNHSLSLILMHRSLLPATILLVAVFILFEHSAIDLQVQDHFFNFQTGEWWLNKQQNPLRLVCYSGIKYGIFAFGIALIGFYLIPSRMRGKIIGPSISDRDLWVVVATLITAPSLVALGKATTNVHCPYQLSRYGGAIPYVKVIEPMPPSVPTRSRGRGFPAGHASGGFALLSLAGLGKTRRGVVAGITTGLVCGGIMGTYQMLNGNHFLSHTLITAILCWIVFLLWRKVMGQNDQAPSVGS